MWYSVENKTVPCDYDDFGEEVIDGVKYKIWKYTDESMDGNYTITHYLASDENRNVFYEMEEIYPEDNDD